ncbi:MAG: hypothetical protein K2W88_00770 [Pararheinheimera sp.]|nr:hypothetical protein [Rheinheimera sp.]
MEKIQNPVGPSLSEVIDAIEGAAEVSADTYAKIMRALPSCYISSVKNELEYIDVQLGLLEDKSADEHLPMFQGMRRLLKKF